MHLLVLLILFFRFSSLLILLFEDNFLVLFPSFQFYFCRWYNFWHVGTIEYERNIFGIRWKKNFAPGWYFLILWNKKNVLWLKTDLLSFDCHFFLLFLRENFWLEKTCVAKNWFSWKKKKTGKREKEWDLKRSEKNEWDLKREKQIEKQTQYCLLQECLTLLVQWPKYQSIKDFLILFLSFFLSLWRKIQEGERERRKKCERKNEEREVPESHSWWVIPVRVWFNPDWMFHTWIPIITSFFILSLHSSSVGNRFFVIDQKD